MLVKNTLVVSGLTLVSRIVGFIRTILLAYFFGASVYLDAFFIAFKLPNLFRRLFAEGSISAALIPTLSHISTESERKSFFAHLFSMYIVMLGGFIVLAFFCAPLIIRMFYVLDNDVPPIVLSSATLYLQLMFPYLFVISLAALCQGVLNYSKHFIVPAVSPVAFNVLLLVYLLLNYFFWKDKHISEQLCFLSLTVLLAGIVQFVMHIPIVLKHKYSFHFIFNLKDKNVRTFLLLLSPVVLAAGLHQLNIVLVEPIALSLGAGVVSILHYSNRLIEMPLGIIVISLTTVGLPLLAKQAANKDFTLLNDNLKNMVKYLILLITPIAIFGFFYREQIVSFVFAGGALSNTGNNVALLMQCFQYHILSIPMIALNRIFITTLLSLKQARAMLYLAVSSLLFNVICCLVLTKGFGGMSGDGIALASLFTSLLTFGMSITLLTNRLVNFKPAFIFTKTLKVLLLSVAIALGLSRLFHLFWQQTELWFFDPNVMSAIPFIWKEKLYSLGQLVLTSITFFGLYFGALILMGDADAKNFFRLIVQRVKRR